MEISLDLIKDLRHRSGAGIMDCKKALKEGNGNMDEAIRLLKEWGISKAAKKGDRLATEGVIVAVSRDGQRSLVEVNCETDFVAQTKEYQAFAAEIAGKIVDQKIQDKQDLTVQLKEELATGVLKFGENVVVGRILTIAGKGILGSYIHNNYKRAACVLLEIDTLDIETSFKKELEEIAFNLSVQLAVSPEFDGIDEADLSQDVLQEKREEFRKEVLESGKPENMVNKIVEGKMNRFFKDCTFLPQVYLMDESYTVQSILENISSKIGYKVKLKSFQRLMIGE